MESGSALVPRIDLNHLEFHGFATSLSGKSRPLAAAFFLFLSIFPFGQILSVIKISQAISLPPSFYPELLIANACRTVSF